MFGISNFEIFNLLNRDIILSYLQEKGNYFHSQNIRDNKSL